MSETQVRDWCDLPSGTYEGANRYSTDDEEVLTLWRDGETWDLRAPRRRSEARVANRWDVQPLQHIDLGTFPPESAADSTENPA